MKVRREAVIVFARLAAEKFKWNTVAAFVVVRRGVQRLMKIADEMNDVAKGFGAFRGLGGFIFENLDLCGEGFVDATFLAAIRSKVAVAARIAARYVDVMPRAVVALRADVIRPRGCVAHWVVDGGATVALELRVGGIFFQQREDEFFCLGREVLFSDQGDGFVALAAPGGAGR